MVLSRSARLGARGRMVGLPGASSPQQKEDHRQCSVCGCEKPPRLPRNPIEMDGGHWPQVLDREPAAVRQHVDHDMQQPTQGFPNRPPCDGPCCCEDHPEDQQTVNAVTKAKDPIEPRPSRLGQERLRNARHAPPDSQNGWNREAGEVGEDTEEHCPPKTNRPVRSPIHKRRRS